LFRSEKSHLLALDKKGPLARIAWERQWNCSGSESLEPICCLLILFFLFHQDFGFPWFVCRRSNVLLRGVVRRTSGWTGSVDRLDCDHLLIGTWTHRVCGKEECTTVRFGQGIILVWGTRIEKILARSNTTSFIISPLALISF
jgi:hypothetical protein